MEMERREGGGTANENGQWAIGNNEELAMHAHFLKSVPNVLWNET